MRDSPRWTNLVVASAASVAAPSSSGSSSAIPTGRTPSTPPTRPCTRLTRPTCPIASSTCVPLAWAPRPTTTVCPAYDTLVFPSSSVANLDSPVGGYRQGRLPWMHPTLYPVEKTLFEGADTSPDAPLVVDVAGGLGHDIDEFKQHYPNHPGVRAPFMFTTMGIMLLTKNRNSSFKTSRWSSTMSKESTRPLSVCRTTS